VQNKLQWAITGQTTAEIISLRADSTKENMGLTNWGGDKIRKADVAKLLKKPKLVKECVCPNARGTAKLIAN